MKSICIQEQVAVEDEDLLIPQNCWAFIEEEDGTKRLVVGTVKASQKHKLRLVPKCAGG